MKRLRRSRKDLRKEPKNQKKTKLKRMKMNVEDHWKKETKKKWHSWQMCQLKLKNKKRKDMSLKKWKSH